MASESNPFTSGSLGLIFLKTALPIIFVMSMSGLLAVVDVVFLGVFVGADAVAAVTLIFPIFMVIVASATMIGSGMSSILARDLGGGRRDQAREVFTGAHGLAMAFGAGLVTFYLLFGELIVNALAAGNSTLASMAITYLGVTAAFAPLFFLLAVNSDALRNEGYVGFMALMSLLVSMANIAFNYIAIVLMDLGVAGSAYGTAAAQALSLVIIFLFRLKAANALHPRVLFNHSPVAHWREILALGSPRSLSFIGIALGSATLIAALQIFGATDYDVTVSAYGIITRIMTFAFLPLLGMSMAMQTITGHNYGARLWRRSDACLKLGMLAAFLYCLAIQLILTSFSRSIGFWFVDDVAVVDELARIMPIMMAMFFLAGPLMIIATYFQAIGDAMRAAILSLAKPYGFAIPLTFLLPLFLGEQGIWFAGPFSEILLLATTILLLANLSRKNGLRWGMFKAQVQI